MNGNMQLVSLRNILQEYKEINTENLYRPVAVGKYGIRKREDIYSKELAKDYSKNKIIHEGTLTVGMGSSQIDIGILSSNEIYSVSPAYKTFNIKNINYDYLRYYLEHRNKDMSKRYLLASCRQGKTVDIKRWLDYKVVVYSIETQTKIVDNIDKINDLISKQQKALILLDNLVKSRFREMFGDPISQEKNIRLLTISKYCTLKAGKFVKASDIYLNKGNELYPCFGGNGLRGYVRTYTHIGEYPLIGRQGALCGNVKYATGKFHATEHAIVVTPKIEINKRWLYMLLFQLKLNRYATGAAQPGLAVATLEKIHIQIPTLALQNEFADFVQRIDKSKVEIQKSLDKLEMLKKSLMQQYFG